MRIVLVALVLLVGLTAHAEDHMRKTALPTPLDIYVAAPDDAYRYEVVSEEAREDWTSYTLKLVSQRWLTEAEVDRPLWEHWVTVCVPKEVKHQTAFLFIGGGGNDGEAPRVAGGIVRRLSAETGSITVELGQIPNQPLTFTDDGKARKEDSMIAYTWDKFLRTGDTKWPARLPMTKAVVRCMDAVQAFCKEKLPAPVEVKDFVVGGGSKRGWTTWTTAAVDTRVRAVVPIVIDLLNLKPSFRHHWSAYGFWAPAVDDYEDMKIFDRMETPEYAELMKIVEPYHYLERFTMPKFVVSAASDEFFLPDSSQFYWDELPGPKRMRYLPNSGHGLGGTDVLDSVLAFYNSILENAALPEYEWRYPDDRSIAVKSGVAPKEVLLWQATNDKARDFRLDQVGDKAWTSTPLMADANGEYTGTVETPGAGWRAYLVELTFDVPGNADLKFTSPVRITPDTLPFKYVPNPNPEPGYLSAK
jgi:PhoPQ-activated pathogenicity-related protein